MAQVSYKIAGTLVGQYTIQAGDTLSVVAEKLNVELDTLLATNPGVKPESLWVGQTINVPSDQTGAVLFTLGDVARVLGISVSELQSTNPGISNDLVINQVIATPAPSQEIPGSSGGSEGGGSFVDYPGIASQLPHPSQWARYAALWESNVRLMKYNSSDSEIALIKESIERVARESGVDVRVILCIIMQESGGNVRVGTSDNGVRNPGLMQSHNGVEFDPADPAHSILQMVRDGTTGTRHGDGLKHCFAHQGNWYAAFREYNSGPGFNKADLNDPSGATAHYVKNTANRLMGHVWDGM
ncbi:hypothetical protein LTR84_011593 [Exophiala bonariae]|uniref:LysM domain-containing protein n=1 Tax=Exophiala bonariae TaxID=1690606 RepID=A0AAV9NK31_9EURO|nr:hypothetical protein LTR84_011593 [Exophiala bonariae]